MSKDPAFLFYSSDFLTGTMFLNNEQVGMFVRLLCAQHQKGRLKEKDMLNICKTYDEDVFSMFQKDKNGLYFNARLEEEHNKRKAYSESRRQNRLKKDNPLNNTSKTYVKHMENENENENINRNKNENSLEAKIIEKYPFQDFYDLYSKKRHRAKAESYWRKLSDNRRRLAMDHTQKFVVSEEKQFRPDPHRYLRDRGWENEIIIKQNGQKRDYSELEKKLAQTTE